MRSAYFQVMALLLFFQLFEGCLHDHSQASPVQVLISSQKHEVKFGDPIFISVSVTNKTDAAITLARPLDQSESRFRYPRCVFELRDENGEIVNPAWVGDKPPDPITAQAFFSLEAGQDCALYLNGLRLDSIIPYPGTYKITLTYSTLAEKEWEWYGPYSDQYWEERHHNVFWQVREPEILKIRKFLKKLTRVEISSNSLLFEILSRNVTKEEALQVAEKVCSRENWPFLNAHAIDRGAYWDINTNWGRLGQNVFVRVDKKTGRVLQRQLTGG